MQENGAIGWKLLQSMAKMLRENLASVQTQKGS